jgi:hypothetical protein
VVDYALTVDGESLSPLESVRDCGSGGAVMAVAANFPAAGGGTVRLIDNMRVWPPSAAEEQV